MFSSAEFDKSPEADEQCQARHRVMLRESAELGMRAARSATRQLEANADNSEKFDNTASLTLARAIQAVHHAIALEQHIMAGFAAAKPPGARNAAKPPTRSAAISDPRRAPVRDALRAAAAKSEPDRSARNHLNTLIDEVLDTALIDDPARAIPIGRVLLTVASELGIRIDVSQLPDQLLGIPPRRPPSFVPNPNEPADTG